jgi:hypothetical protein
MRDRIVALLKRAYAWAWALAGNSRTLAVAYAAEVLGALDEAQVLDWSALLGVERGGRVMAIMGVAIFGLRMITRTAVSFRPQE